MPDRNESSLPDSSFTSHSSMSDETDADTMAIKATQWLAREGHLARALSNWLTNLPGHVLAEPGLAWHPVMRSLAESSLLLYDNPGLILYAPQFTSLYRLLRLNELRHGARRGGAVLLIGSGRTYPEALAALIAPPQQQALSRLRLLMATSTLVDKLEDYTRRRNEGEALMVAPALVDGHVTALDPDKHALDYGKRIGPQFGVTYSNTEYVETALGAAVHDGIIPTGLDSMIWNRVDPSVVHPASATTRERRANIHSLVYELAMRIKPGGRLVLTVGTGNSKDELFARLRVVQEMKALLPAAGFQVVLSSTNFAASDETISMHDERYGSIAGLVAMKR